MEERWATSLASAMVMVRTPSGVAAAFISTSTPLRALRTSPPLAWARYSFTPSSQQLSPPSSSSMSFTARSTAGSRSSGVRALNSKTVDRDKMALKMVK